MKMHRKMIAHNYYNDINAHLYDAEHELINYLHLTNVYLKRYLLFVCNNFNGEYLPQTGQLFVSF